MGLMHAEAREEHNDYVNIVESDMVDGTMDLILVSEYGDTQQYLANLSDTGLLLYKLDEEFHSRPWCDENGYLKVSKNV